MRYTGGMPGPDLRALRSHLGLTQADLARRLGVSLRCYQRWEATALPRTRAQMIRLALASIAG